MTLEQWETIFKDVVNKKSNIYDIDWEEIIEQNGVVCCKKDTLRKSQDTPFGGYMVSQYYKYKELNKISKEEESTDNDVQKQIDSYRSEDAINKDGTFTSDKLIIINKNDLKDKSYLLSAHGFDPKEWELVSARNNIWNVYSKQDGIQELYSSKIVVKPRTEISIEEISEFYQDLIKTYQPPKVKRYDVSNDGCMVELPIFDLHLGKLSSSDIVEKEYNSQIARDCFNYIIDQVINRLQGKKIEKILFPVGQDFFHYDCVGSMTTGGTPQDTDVKHQQLFKDGVLLLIDGIEKLSRELKTTVDVFVVQGNHDFMTSYHGVMSLWCYFHNNENVIVDLGTSPRKYRRFGKSLIGYTHGDKEKKRIDNLMQEEAKEDWGLSTYREWHMGHLHSEQTRESGGIIFRNLSSVTGTDAWHHNSGYVGSVRKCQCFIWDKEYGLDTILNVVIR